MKIDRRAVHQKFNGRCAYCDQKITLEQMRVDHFWPKARAHMQPGQDNDRPSNLMPSCRKCNHHKRAEKIEVWRKEFALQVARLRKNAQFDRALRFGQIKITESPIVFYFEKFCETEDNNP